MALVIGLHGAKGSGKDQFYKAAKEGFPELDIRKVAYADPIKNQICRIFNLDGEDEYDSFKRTSLQFSLENNNPYNVDGRQVVREIGMLMRSYDESQFTKYVETEIEKAPNAIWCITDVRFMNEVISILHNLNGMIVKINRSGYTFDGHVTETEIPNEMCRHVIKSENLNLEQYNNIVIDFMKTLLEDDQYNENQFNL